VRVVVVVVGGKIPQVQAVLAVVVQAVEVEIVIQV
jgi:hypothetical protein